MFKDNRLCCSSTPGSGTGAYPSLTKRGTEENPLASYRLHADHLGSTVLTTGVSGSKKYYAYGATRTGSVPTDYGFTSQQEDGGTGLIYLHARFYDSATGRFLMATPYQLAFLPN